MNRALARPIFWPLVLIAVGVLWLLTNFNVVAKSNLGILLRLWPILLIGLGLDLIVRPRWPVIGNLITVGVVALGVLAVIFAPQLGYIGSGYGSWFPIPWMWGSERGSGRVINEARNVSDFNAVSFSGVGDLLIQQGDHEGLRIEAEDNVLGEIKAEVQNGTLYLGLREDNWFRVQPTQPIRFTVTVRQLKQLDLSGLGNVVVETLEADRLRTSLGGAGNLSFKDLSANDLIVNLSGTGSIDATGQTKRLETHVSGVGSYKGNDLQSETVSVSLSGLGSAIVWATKTLNAQISGLGSVQYYGNPTVTESLSGLGSLQHLGDK